MQQGRQGRQGGRWCGAQECVLIQDGVWGWLGPGGRRCLAMVTNEGMELQHALPFRCLPPRFSPLHLTRVAHVKHPSTWARLLADPPSRAPVTSLPSLPASRSCCEAHGHDAVRAGHMAGRRRHQAARQEHVRAAGLEQREHLRCRLARVLRCGDVCRAPRLTATGVRGWPAAAHKDTLTSLSLSGSAT